MRLGKILCKLNLVLMFNSGKGSKKNLLEINLKGFFE
jgi:hypothetical protein